MCVPSADHCELCPRGCRKDPDLWRRQCRAPVDPTEHRRLHSYQPVALIDDARGKRNLRLLGVPVLGGRDRLLEVAEERGATTVILAITDATAGLVRETSALAEGAGLRLLVLPPVLEMLGGQVRLSDIREVDIEEILGRHQIQTDLREIARFLTGHCVLVTGAGGSIGSELARQVRKFGPKELILLDRDESALHAVQLSIYGSKKPSRQPQC